MSPTRRNFNELSMSSIQTCPKCSYVEKIYESQQNQIMALEEHKSSLIEIKDILKAYYSVDHIPFTSKYIPEVEELGVELPSINHLKSVSVTKQEGENLKNTLLGLTEKLRVFHSVRDDVKILRQQLFESQVNRLNLQTKANEKIEGFGDNSEEMVEKRVKLSEDQLNIKLEICDQQHSKALKIVKMDTVKSEISNLKSNLEQLKAELKNLNMTKTHISKLECELSASSLKRDNLTSEYNKFLEIFSQNKAKHLENIQKLKTDRIELIADLSLLKKEISDYKSENEASLKTNNLLELEIKAIQCEIYNLKEANKEIEKSRLLATEKEDSIITLHHKISKASENFTIELKQLSEANSNLLKHKLNVVEELNKLDNLLEVKNVEVQDLTRNNYSSIVQCTLLEQQVCIQNDRLSIQKHIDMQQEVNERIKNVLLSDISMMGEKLKEQSIDCVKLSKEVEIYKKKLDEKNNYRKEIKRIISDLKGYKKVYTAFRGEQVDELLADILNDRSDWIHVGVQRLSSECYRFGTKEVKLSIQSNEIIVEFGRARMDLGEFLQVYIPLEAQKIKYQNKN